MKPPLEPDERDEELLAAYRRASAQDGRGPNPRVRARVLAQVRREHAPAAANDGTWRWQAVAGIAVIGFAGLLVRHSFHDAAPHTAAVTTAPTPAAPAAPPATIAVPSEIGAGVAKSAAGPAIRLRREPVAAEAAKATADWAAQSRAAAPPAAPPASPPATPSGASRGAALEAVAQPRAGEVLPDETQVRRAVTARFSALFLPQDSAQLNLVTVVMDRNGGIARFAVATIPATDLAASGYLRLDAKSTVAGEPDKVLLVRYAWPREALQ